MASWMNLSHVKNHRQTGGGTHLQHTEMGHSKSVGFFCSGQWTFWYEMIINQNSVIEGLKTNTMYYSGRKHWIFYIIKMGLQCYAPYRCRTGKFLTTFWHLFDNFHIRWPIRMRRSMGGVIGIASDNLPPFYCKPCAIFNSLKSVCRFPRWNLGWLRMNEHRNTCKLPFLIFFKVYMYNIHNKLSCPLHIYFCSCVQLRQNINGGIFNNYSPKWRWIVVDIHRAAKRRVKYPPLSPTLTWLIVVVYTTQAEQLAAQRVTLFVKI